MFQNVQSKHMVYGNIFDQWFGQAIHWNQCFGLFGRILRFKTLQKTPEINFQYHYWKSWNILRTQWPDNTAEEFKRNCWFNPTFPTLITLGFYRHIAPARTIPFDEIQFVPTKQREMNEKWSRSSMSWVSHRRYMGSNYISVYFDTGTYCHHWHWLCRHLFIKRWLLLMAMMMQQ